MEIEPLKNKKHQAFVEAYFENNLNATRAYAKVYGKNDAISGTCGQRLLQKVEIRAKIAEIQAKSAKKVLITREEIMQDLVDIKNAQKENFSPSALKAIEILNKMCGFNSPDKVEHSGGFDICLNIPGVNNQKSLEENNQKFLDEE